jgi:Xaa-Pro aminopeptidase
MHNYFYQRLNLLRGELALKRNEAFFTNIREEVLYLTSFDSSNSNLLVTKDKTILFTDKRYSQQVKALDDFIQVEFIEKDLIDSLQKFCMRNKLDLVYFDRSKLSLQRFDEFKKIKSVKFQALKKDISFLFAIQDDLSISYTKKAIKITEKIFEQILGEIKEGISEKDLKAEIKYLITKMSYGEAFDPIVLFGKNSAHPHGKSSDQKLKKNDPILIDFGVNVSGYNSDFTRTIYFGKPDKEFKTTYKIVRSALQIAIENLEVNNSVKEIAQSVIDYFSTFGLEKNFTHALGHGLGVYLHNFPRISTQSNHYLPENIVLAIEPALYFENKFGIRIEQDVLLTKSKKEILTKITDELIII